MRLLQVLLQTNFQSRVVQEDTEELPLLSVSIEKPFRKFMRGLTKNDEVVIQRVGNFE